LNCFIAVPDGMHGIERLVFLERSAHQENVVRIIFGHQHWAEI
jgi:hypothetical protein